MMNAQQKNLMNSIRDKEARRAELFESLDRSLEVQALDPEAFNHGKVTSVVIGNPYSPETMKWVLTRGDGMRREFPLLSVPECLWGGFSREVANEVTRGRVPCWRPDSGRTRVRKAA